MRYANKYDERTVSVGHSKEVWQALNKEKFPILNYTDFSSRFDIIFYGILKV